MTRTTSISCLRSPDPCLRSWRKPLSSLTPLTRSQRSLCPPQKTLQLCFFSLITLSLQVVDQYLNFVTLTNKLFSFNQQDVYHILNNPKATDTEIEALVEKIASSLFSVVLTLGKPPTPPLQLPTVFEVNFHFFLSQVKSLLSAAHEEMRLNWWRRSWTRRSGSTSRAPEQTCSRRWIQ